MIRFLMRRELREARWTCADYSMPCCALIRSLAAHSSSMTFGYSLLIVDDRQEMDAAAFIAGDDVGTVGTQCDARDPTISLPGSHLVARRRVPEPERTII